MDDIFQTLFRDTNVSKLTYRDENLNNYDAYTCVEITEAMAALRAPNSVILDFYLFFPASGSVITPDYRLNNQIFYSRIQNYPGVDNAQWRQLLCQGYSTEQYLPELKGGGTLTFARTLFLTSDLNYNPVLVCSISVPTLQQQMERLLGATDLSGRIIRPEDGAVLAAWPEATDGTEIIELDSALPGLRYQIVLDPAGLQDGVRTALKTIVAVVVSGMIVSLAAAFLLAYSNYAPIRRLVGRVAGADNGQGDRHNELGQIESVISDSFAHQEKLMQSLEKMAPVYVNHYLYSVLSGQVEPDAAAQETLERYGIRFPGGFFLAVDLYFYPGDSAEDWEPELVHMVSKNILGELFEDAAQIAYMVHETRSILALINLERELPAQEIDRRLRRLHELVCGRMRQGLTLFVSDPVAGFEQTPEAFRQVQQITQSVRYLGAQDIVRWADIHAGDNGVRAFTVEDETVLMNCIRAGDGEKTVRLLDQFFDRQQGRAAPDPYFAVHLLSAYLKACQFLDYPIQGDASALIRVPSVDRLQAGFHRAFRELCAFAAEKSAKTNRLLDQILRLVDQYYHDDQLSITFLAEKLNLNVSYLSASFKKWTGDHLSTYINRVRVDRAKALLSDPSCSIAQAAQAVGYRSDVALIRAFKKIEGVTPGTYRKNLP